MYQKYYMDNSSAAGAVLYEGEAPEYLLIKLCHSQMKLDPAAALRVNNILFGCLQDMHIY